MNGLQTLKQLIKELEDIKIPRQCISEIHSTKLILDKMRKEIYLIDNAGDNKDGEEGVKLSMNANRKSGSINFDIKNAIKSEDWVYIEQVLFELMYKYGRREEPQLAAGYWWIKIIDSDWIVASYDSSIDKWHSIHCGEIHKNHLVEIGDQIKR